MMSRAVLDSKFNQIVEATATKVDKFYFKRKGVVVRLIRHGNSALIEFQKSTKSSNDAIFFTINLAVVCGELLEPDQPALEQARSLYGHLQERIGFLMPGSQDHWWEITEATNADALAAEVSDIVSDRGVPYIQRYLDTDELVSLWRSGNSPGLTKTQRIRYLEKLSGNHKSVEA